jgi:uncharacterized protein (DUF2062 family)
MIKALLMQGLTPSGVSLSLMLGGAGAVFPVLGTTTMVTGLFSVCFRLNHAIVQAINILATPLQLALILPLLRIGEWVFGVEGISLSLMELTTAFREAPGAFFKTFASSFVHVVAGWVVTVLPVALIGHGVLRIVLRRYAERLRTREVGAIGPTPP